MTDKKLNEMVEEIKKMQKEVSIISSRLAEMCAWIQTHLELKD